MENTLSLQKITSPALSNKCTTAGDGFFFAPNTPPPLLSDHPNDPTDFCAASAWCPAAAIRFPRASAATHNNGDSDTRIDLLPPSPVTSIARTTPSFPHIASQFPSTPPIAQHPMMGHGAVILRVAVIVLTSVVTTTPSAETDAKTSPPAKNAVHDTIAFACSGKHATFVTVPAVESCAYTRTRPSLHPDASNPRAPPSEANEKRYPGRHRSGTAPALAAALVAALGVALHAHVRPGRGREDRAVAAFADERAAVDLVAARLVDERVNESDRARVRVVRVRGLLRAGLRDPPHARCAVRGAGREDLERRVPRDADDLVLMAAAHAVGGRAVRGAAVEPHARGLVLARGREQAVVPRAERDVEDAA
eukprot:31476-Pelagococcus_subviridis.AAC.12